MTQQGAKKKKRIYFRQLLQEKFPLVHAEIFSEVSIFLKSWFEVCPPRKYLGIYWPLPNEVDLRPLKSLMSFQVALPATNSSGGLSYHQWTNQPLLKDASNIPSSLKEPPLEASSMSLLLVPALAIDRRGLRLGYGGGFYDRLRSNNQWRSVPCFAILPEACVSDELLPSDVWDIPFDGWISECGLTSFLDN